MWVCVFVTFSRSIFCKLSSYWNWQWQSYLGICWQQKSSQFIAYMYIQNSSMYLARFCLQRPLFWGSFWKFLLVSRTFPGEKAARSYSKKKSVFMLANLRFFKPARLFYQIVSWFWWAKTWVQKLFFIGSDKQKRCWAINPRWECWIYIVGSGTQKLFCVEYLLRHIS